MADDNVDPERIVKVEIFNGEIWAQTPYGNQYYFRRLGARWDKKRELWHMPLSLDMCRNLRKFFDKELQIGKKLNAWARDAIAEENALAEMVKAGEAKLDKLGNHQRLVEAMSTRTYQQVGAKFIAKQRQALIADEPGLGKTLEAIAGLIEADCWQGLILVAAPLTSLRPVWDTELKKYAPDAYTVIGVPQKRDSAYARGVIIQQWVEHYLDNPESPHILVVNPEMVRDAKKKYQLLCELEFQALVLDESHKYLSGVKGKQDVTQVGKGILGLKLANDGVKIALSGTPMRGKPKNLWGTLHWLRPEQYPSFWKWAERYLVMYNSGWGTTYGEVKPYAEKEFFKSLDDVMLRRTKAEVVKELPPKQRITVYCDMTDAQQRMYVQMRDKAMAELIDMEDEALSAVGILAVITRLKQFSNCAWRAVQTPKPVAMFEPIHSGKASVILEMLEERGIAGPKDDRQGENKIVIASQFTQVINSCEEWLASIGVETLKITGEVRESERVAVTSRWQAAGGPRVMLMNTTAGGVSITLDAYCDELVIIDETWTPDDQEQLEDRIHRVSRIHQVTIYYLKCKDTIDEYISDVTGRKEAITKAILDGRRGVDNYIRAIIGGIR